MMICLRLLLAFLFSLLLTACGGGGGSAGGVDEGAKPITISGIAIDNYISGATVCIDTDKNNICESGETNTSTDPDGKFSFPNIIPVEDMVIIAYEGKDTKTKEDFPYIVKNLVANTDANGTVILSSLNTLVTDYKRLSNKTLDESKKSIADFIESSDGSNVVQDIIANKTTLSGEYLRSLKIFQMVAELNDLNNSQSSAKSFQAIAKAIIDTNNTVTHKSDLNLTIDGVSKQLIDFVSAPVFMDIPTPTPSGVSGEIMTIDFIESPDGEPISYTISGADASKFTITDTNKLSFSDDINDSDYATTKNITLTATVGTKSVSKDIGITLPSNPIIPTNPLTNIDLSNTSLTENNIENAVVGTLSAQTSSGTLTYFLVDGTGATDNGSFAIDGASLKITESANYESKTSYSIRVRVSDGTNSYEEVFIINITDVNEDPTDPTDPVTPTNNPPVFTSNNIVTINENQLFVVDINATDAESNDINYTISGANASLFDINISTGVVTFKNLVDNNYETNTSYSFTAEVTDGVNSVEQNITVLIQNVAERVPVLSSFVTSIDENITIGTVVGNVTIDSGDTPITLLTLSDTTNFEINTSGTITTKTSFDYETLPNLYTLTLYATNTKGTSGSVDVNISINNVAETVPVLSSFVTSIDENITIGTVVGNVTIDSGDTPITLLTLSDTTNFEINTSGTITTKTSFDYETLPNLYTLALYATNAKGTSGSVDVNISINNINNNNPVITSSSSQTIFENNISVMTVTATDADNLGALEFRMGSENNSSLFDINSSTGVVTFKNLDDNDYEKAQSYNFRVVVSDGELTTDQNITLSINSVNTDAPQFTSSNIVTINENQLFVIDINATDTDSTDLNYSISGGTDASLFAIDSSTGVVTFRDINDSDYEKAHSYTFTANVTDGSYITSQDITLNITNLNDNPPVFNQDNNVTIPENQSSVITDLHVTDADGNLTTLTYSISDGNASLFDINSSTGKITFNDINSNNYENVQSFSFKVTVDDGEHNATQDINITISNLNDNPPVFVGNYSVSVDENQTFAIDINGTDSDDNNLTFSIVEDVNDFDKFDINSSTGIVTFKSNQLPDYESVKKSYSFTARVDDGIYTVDQNITIDINNINDTSPVFTSNTTQSVDENNASAFITLSVTDADNLGVVTYAISGGDSISFEANSSTGVVAFTFTPDYETKTSYSFTVTASDGENNTTQSVTININNLVEITNDSPTDLILSANTITENNLVGVTVGTLSSVDADTPAGPFVYSLVQGSGDTHNGLFSIDGNTLKIGVVANYETNSSYSIRIQTKDDGNATFEKQFDINVTNVNEPAYFDPITPQSFYQKSYSSFVIKAHEVDITTPLSKLVTTTGNTFSTTDFAVIQVDGNDTKDINITVSGTGIDTQVGQHTFKIYVKQTDNNVSISQDVVVNILDVNDAPQFTNVNYDSQNYPFDEDGNTLFEDINISYGTSKTITFTVHDGDSKDSQTIDLNATSSDTGVIPTPLIVSNITPSTYNDTLKNHVGTFAVTLEGLQEGESNITVNLKDRNGTANDGRDSTSFTFKAKVRANGWKIYENQKASGYTINSVDFDGINYVWDSTNRWYATVDANLSLQKILMPMKLNVNSYNDGKIANSGNVHLQAPGHYYVNKNEYMHASRVAEGEDHSVGNYYERADGNIPGIKAADRKFQHDKDHHAFVSTIIYGTTSFITKYYNDPDDDNLSDDGDSWIYEKTSTYVDANDTNNSWGTAISLSTGYATTSQKVDRYNDGNDTCAVYFGDGWRLPTAYEMGIKVQTATDGYFGYIPSYVGSSNLNIISSSRAVDVNRHWIMLGLYGYADQASYSKDAQYVRCIYVP